MPPLFPSSFFIPISRLLLSFGSTCPCAGSCLGAGSCPGPGPGSGAGPGAGS